MVLIRRKKRLPKAGWRAVDVLDLLRSEQFPGTCERCGRADLRFLHRMTHPEASCVLHVGSECAKRLSSGVYDPKPLERRLTNLWNRRSRFPFLHGWSVSKKGNEYLKVADSILTVFADRNVTDRYRACIKSEQGTRFSPDSYSSVIEAKLAAFDELTAEESG
jgi:hypothetical protein